MTVGRLFGLAACFHHSCRVVQLGNRSKNPWRLFCTTFARNHLRYLTEKQKLQYEQDGCLVVKDVFDAEEVGNLRKALDGIIQKGLSMTESDEHIKLEPDHSTSKPLVRRVICPSLMHPVFDEAIRHPKLLDLVCDLIGPSVRFVRQDRINLKLPGGDGSVILWHQDWAFVPSTNDDLVTVGIALDDCTRENGCLQVIPGSHKGPLYSHFDEDGKFVSAINDSTFEPSSPAYLQAPTGGVTLHHIRAVHGSSHNQSNSTRRLFLLCYCANDSWPLLGVGGPEYRNNGPVDWELFCSTVVRGEVPKFPRMENIPICIPVPFDAGYDVFDHGKTNINQAPKE